jgi:hypothetical protein
MVTMDVESVLRIKLAGLVWLHTISCRVVLAPAC